MTYLKSVFSHISSHLLSCFLLLACLSSPVPEAAPFPGGFLEKHHSDSGVRPLLTRSEILDVLPERGKFTFPAPYNTEAIRLTNADACYAQDCVNYIGYSYWNNINNHVGQDTMLIFLGLDKSHGGVGPSLLQYNKLTDAVENLGPLFPASSPYSWATGEGWYFSTTMPAALYIPDQARLQRFDVMTQVFTTVFDVTATFGSGHYINQAHSSADDRVHSATLSQQGTWARLGCVVYREDTGQIEYFPSIGVFDECQIDKSGDWLVIKDNVDYLNGEDNRIINLATGQERVLLDEAGAAGHSDLGYGYMAQADNFATDANSWEVWDFTAPLLTGIVAYHNSDWSVDTPDHLSHSNAVAGPAATQFACGSSAHRSYVALGNDIVCFRLDDHSPVLIVAPVMTDLDASGGGDEYARAPKGNLDVTGKYFIWSSNMGGDRLDVFLVKVPSHLLGLTFATGPLVWDQVVNATAVGGSLTKTGGCDGCADAGAVSRDSLVSGDGFLEFTVNGSRKQFYAGLSVSQEGTDHTQIDYALSMLGNHAEVRENGTHRANTLFVNGDVLRIAVKNEHITYARNGYVFYTSTVAPVYPLRVYAVLLEADSSISIAGGGAVLNYTSPTVSAQICGVKFNDLNGNGAQEAGELGLANWQIGAGLADTPPVATDFKGAYCISDLSPGTYTVAEVLQAPWLQTFPVAPDSHTVTLSAGQQISGIDFGSTIPSGVCNALSGSPYVRLGNGSFETAPLVNPGTFSHFDEALVPSWSTTAADGLMAVWSNRYGGVTAYSGNQFLELNSTVGATVYQDFTAIPGSTVTITFAHRGRAGFLNQMTVSLGAIGSSPTTLGTFTASTSAWTLNRVSYTFPDNGQTAYKIGFVASDPLPGGNFLDDIQMIDVACLNAEVTDTSTLDKPKVFTFVESTYPHLFNGPGVTTQADLYTYRFYEQTNNYLAIDEMGTIFMRGRFTDNALIPLGTIVSFTKLIREFYAGPVANSRLFGFATGIYPEIFGGVPVEGNIEQYDYRYFPQTGNILAIDNAGMLYVLGPFSNYALTRLGEVESWRTAITAWEAGR